MKSCASKGLVWVAGLCFLALSTAGMSQTFSFGQASYNVLVDGTVSVSVEFENGGSPPLASVVFRIPIDEANIAVNFTGCPPVPPPATTAFTCSTADFNSDGNIDSIAININNFPNAINDFPSASFDAAIFEITVSGLADGATVPLDFEILAAEDTNNASVDPGDITTNNSQLNVVTAPPAVLDVDPLMIDFGVVQTSTTSAEQPIAICNDGDPGALDLTVNNISVAPAQFDEGAGSTCAGTPFDLPQGSCCDYHVTFSPDAEAAFNGTVLVETSAGDETVTLEGQGQDSDANLTITGDGAFGSLDIDADPICRAFTLTNTATNDGLTVTAASVAAPFSVSDDCDGAALAPGATCGVEVCFDPDADGAFSEDLTVTSSANTATAALTGTGTSESDIAVDPPFGPVNLGNGPAGTVFEEGGSATNNGSASGTFSCDLVGDPEITISPDLSGGITLGPGESADFTLSCALPIDGEDGDTFEATLTCSGDVAGTHEISCGVFDAPAVPVPTMQNWALILFALMMLLVGGISIRAFRVN
jgi:hypothetical protein